MLHLFGAAPLDSRLVLLDDHSDCALMTDACDAVRAVEALASSLLAQRTAAASSNESWEHHVCRILEKHLTDAGCSVSGGLVEVLTSTETAEASATLARVIESWI